MKELGLTRTEATLVSQWLDEKGKAPLSGWISLWRVKPSEIAKEYDVEIDEVLRAARRKTE